MKYFNTTHPIAILLLFIALFFALSSPVRAAEPEIIWTAHPAAEANEWQSVAWSPELGLFVAVSSDGTNRVMTSPDGINWTARAAAQARAWNSVTWSPELGLFVAVACGIGSGICDTGFSTNRVMTSPDGINWTARADAEDNSWHSLTWSPELGLFVTVSPNGTNRVMTSPDGVTWTARAAAEDNSWHSVAWSPELGLFAAVAQSGTNRVMTSPDGITWTARAAAEASVWHAVAWSPELGLFVALAQTGTNRVMTSPDGITWTARAAAASHFWRSVTWSPELNLFVAVSSDGTNRVMTSPDGITWTARAAAEANEWVFVTWSPELDRFVALAQTGTNRVMVGTVAPEITTATLPNETIGVSYSQTIGTRFGRTPFTWSITSGSLPGGLSLNTSTGEISGTSTTAGTYNFTVQVEDDIGEVDDQSFSITIAAVQVSQQGNSSSRSSGTSIQGRVKNLQEMGKTDAANALMREWPHLFPGVSSSTVVTAPTPGTCPTYSFTRNLRQGDEGEDVRALQKLLNCLGFALALSGPGAPGEETILFRDRTHNAVVRFQEHFARDVLVPLNLTKGTGYFAEMTRKKMGELMGNTDQ